MERKVLVIGLDGGTWSIFDRFMEAGVMPNLQRLCAAGYRTNLISAIPAITPVAWTSFATGTNPGKHGIYGFSTPRAGSRNYSAPLSRRDLIAVPTLWRHLSDVGLESIVLSVPLTYPPEPIKGSLVTGMLTLGLNSQCTYPPSLKDELLANNCMPRFEMKTMVETDRRNTRLLEALQNDGAEFFEDLDDITEQLRRTVNYLSKKPWDFFMAVFAGTDRLQHVLCDQVISIGPNGSGLLAQRIRNFYSKIDSIIGEMIEAAGNNTTCMLMSDHGFGACAGRYYLGRWLIEAGYAQHQSRPLYHISRKILKITRTESLLLRHLSDKVRTHVASGSYPLDWSQSRAFFVHEDCIQINLKGREKHGIVKPGAEYETLRQELRERLLEIKDPASGKRLISQVWFAEEIYHGKCLQWAPDIVVKASDEPCYVFLRGQLHRSKMTEQVASYTGTHRAEGIFLAYGADVRPNADGSLAQIIDLAPTIMWQLGLPIPADMDGHIIKEAFLSSPVERDIKIATSDSSSTKPPSPGPNASQYTPEEEQALRQRLKDLGYLG